MNPLCQKKIQASTLFGLDYQPCVGAMSGYQRSTEMAKRNALPTQAQFAKGEFSQEDVAFLIDDISRSLNGQRVLAQIHTEDDFAQAMKFNGQFACCFLDVPPALFLKVAGVRKLLEEEPVLTLEEALALDAEKLRSQGAR
jgi:hypothetical protein